MRIAIVTREYPPLTPYTGGIGVHYAAFAPELARQGHDVLVLTLGQEAHTTELPSGVRVVVVPNVLPSPVWYLEHSVWAVRLVAQLRRLGPFDVIFAPEWGGDLALYAYAKSAGPIVTNLVTSSEQVRLITGQRETKADMRVKTALQEPLERRQARRSDALVGCSSAILSWARELWHLDGVPGYVIPNFIDRDRTIYLGSGPLPGWYPSDRPVVLFFGRLEMRKGVQVLAEAMREVWETRPDVQLVLIGGVGPWETGTMLDHVTEVAGPHAANVHAPGPQDPEAMFPAVAAAEVVAFPSLWENFSIAALEARALGAPIIVTGGSGFDDFFTDGLDGLIVPPKEAGALAQAVARLLDNPELRGRLGRAAAASADQYTPEPVTKRFVDVFERAAASPRATGAGRSWRSHARR